MNIINNPDIKWVKGWYLDLHSISSFKAPDGRFNTTYTEIGKLVHEYKYQHKRELKQNLAELLYRAIKSLDELKNLSLITWVPPHNVQVNPVLEPIAIILSQIYGCDYAELVKKNNDRESVKQKTKAEREKILEGAFSLNQQVCDKYSFKKVLMIDDLYQTGSTFKIISNLVSNNTKICLYGLVLTKTRKSPND